MTEIPQNPERAHCKAVEPQRASNPFPIRGHHLPSFADLTRLPFKSTLFINAQMKIIEMYEGGKIKKIKSARSRDRKAQQRLMRWKDYTGDTPDGVKSYTNNLGAVYKKFTKLPDDAPIKLVSGQRDAVCAACVIGEHCDMQYRGKFGVDRTAVSIRDKKYVDLFIKNATAMSLPDGSMRTVEEIATFSDAQPETVQSVLTTAGVLRNVLKNSRF